MLFALIGDDVTVEVGAISGEDESGKNANTESLSVAALRKTASV